MAFPIIPLAIAGGLAALIFGYGKKDDDEPDAPEPSGKGGTKPQPPAGPDEKVGIINSGKSTVVTAGKRYHLLTPFKVVNPGEAGIFLTTRDAGGDFVESQSDEITGEGFSVSEPHREYVIDVIAPGRYHIQMMEGDTFDSAFIAEWNITAE